jgi:hypothetical protein
MSVLAPPPQDELEALIREARARQRKRWLGLAALVALAAGAALGLHAVFGTSHGVPNRSGTARSSAAVVSTSRCGIRAEGTRIFRGGQIVYRLPGHYVHPNGGPPPTIRCSGPAIWATWLKGGGMMQEAYIGARSLDRGRSWKLIFSEGMFGPKAPHQLDAYLGAWTLRGARDAYFTGSCPACDDGALQGTVSLWVTKDGGRTFREYDVPALTGYAAWGIRVEGRKVRIAAKAFTYGVRPLRKTVTIRVS